MCKCFIICELSYSNVSQIRIRNSKSGLKFQPRIEFILQQHVQTCAGWQFGILIPSQHESTAGLRSLLGSDTDALVY